MRKTVILVSGIVIVVFALIALLRIVAGGPEDTWLCVDGTWVRHGNPSSVKPVSPCPR